MIRVIALLTVLACVGCQTTSKQAPKIITPEKEEISVLVTQASAPFQSEYKLQVKWSRFDSDGIEDVLTAPMSSGELEEWFHCDVNSAPKNLKSRISYLINDEKIEVKALPGVNLISKISPVNDQTVHVIGVFSASKFNELGKIIHMSLPIDVTCNLGESKIIYEKEIKLEPVN